LEVDDDEEDEHCAQYVTDVWMRISEEGVLNGTKFVVSEEDTIEQFDESSFILFAFDFSGFGLIG
jgi:hypothetical protein